MPILYSTAGGVRSSEWLGALNCCRIAASVPREDSLVKATWWTFGHRWRAFPALGHELPTRGFHVRRRKLDGVDEIQRLASRCVVLGAERDDVPGPVGRAILLYVCPDLRLVDARLLGAVGREILSTVVLPVLEPGSALAGPLTRAVDVVNSHCCPPSCPYSETSLRNRAVLGCLTIQ